MRGVVWAVALDAGAVVFCAPGAGSGITYAPSARSKGMGLVVAESLLTAVGALWGSVRPSAPTLSFPVGFASGTFWAVGAGGELTARAVSNRSSILVSLLMTSFSALTTEDSSVGSACVGERRVDDVCSVRAGCVSVAWLCATRWRGDADRDRF